jgi:hypothetical protein
VGHYLQTCLAMSCVSFKAYVEAELSYDDGSCIKRHEVNQNEGFLPVPSNYV